MAKYKSVELITKARNKKGKLKGKDKKETKLIKAACSHHYDSKKGNTKPAFRNTSPGVCTCVMCGESFPTSMLENEQVEETVNTMKEMTNQAKFLTVSYDLGPKSNEYFVDMAIRLRKFKKSYLKIKKVALKTDSIKKKKKNRNNDSNSLGGWGPKR